MADFVIGKGYYLEGMVPEMWDLGHPEHGKPYAAAAIYLGSIAGRRRWHAFEVHYQGQEIGVLFMTDQDVEQLTVVEVGLPGGAP